MLTLGERMEADSPDLSVLQTRLASAVSDITKLANAMEALSVGLGRDAAAPERNPIRGHHASDGLAVFSSEIGETSPVRDDRRVANGWASG
jgi:hypothetical protein